MQPLLDRGLVLLLGYSFGCLQFAYFFGKLVKQIDIREYGSGNAGTTNAIRVLGTGWGVLTLFMDILKASCALLVAGLLFGRAEKALLLYCGIGVVLGHNYPFYMKFKGGKGVAATIGIFLVADLRLLMLAGIPALLVLWSSKYMSLASLTYMGLLVIGSISLYHGSMAGLEFILLTALLAASGFYRHRENIVRLFEGRENKLGQKISSLSTKGVADDAIYATVISKKKREEAKQHERNEL